MLITREQIMQVVRQHYNKVVELYGERSVAGIYGYGLVNYGIAEDINEIETLVLYVPTFEELCLAKNFRDEIIEDKIHIKDIRFNYEMVTTQSHELMEAAFTEYYILNPMYEIPLLEIKQHAEQIYHLDPKQRVAYSVQRALADLWSYSKSGDLIKLANAARLNIAIGLYNQNVLCEHCINLRQEYHIRYLLQIKHGEYIPDIDELQESLIKLVNNTIPDNNSCIAAFVKKRLLQVGRIAMSDGQDSLQFLENLSQLEYKALTAIAKKIDYKEGAVVLSQLINETNISRPVFNSLIKKMENNRIATAQNQGVKGTYIKIIDGTVRRTLEYGHNI